MILVATMIGLAYLTQTLGTNATSEEINDLRASGNTARQLISQQTLWVEVRTDSQDVAKRAGELRLRSLGDPTVLRAR